MKVLHIIDSLAPAGAETSLVAMLPYLVDLGIEPEIAVLVDRPGLNDSVAAAGVPVHSVAGPGGRAGAVHRLRALIERRRPALVHTTLFEADLLGRIAALGAGIPVLTSLVNTADPADLLVDSALKRWKLAGVRWIDTALALGATSGFHAITQAVAEHESLRLHIARSRITVVPRGRDRARLDVPDQAGGRELRRSLGVGQEAVVLLNVAREEPQKGQVYLIRALAELRTEGDFHLVIAGRPGRASQRLDAVAAESGTEGLVHRLGHRSDIGALHGAADVFVFPSIYEGLGGAVLEAMACGTPIVASRIPALSEVLADGTCGRLVPPVNSGAIAAAVREVLADPAATSVRTDAARRRFESCYTIEECAARMTRLYAESARLDPPGLARVVSSLRPPRSRSRFRANVAGHPGADDSGR